MFLASVSECVGCSHSFRPRPLLDRVGFVTPRFFVEDITRWQMVEAIIESKNKPFPDFIRDDIIRSQLATSSRTDIESSQNWDTEDIPPCGLPGTRREQDEPSPA